MKTPSYGIDQNAEKTFIDRYYGRLPKFLKRIPEASICVPNKDFMDLVDYVIDGVIDTNNLSGELLAEVNKFIDELPSPWYMSHSDFIFYQHYIGIQDCVVRPRLIDCNALVDCVETIYC